MHSPVEMRSLCFYYVRKLFTKMQMLYFFQGIGYGKDRTKLVNKQTRQHAETT